MVLVSPAALLHTKMRGVTGPISATLLVLLEVESTKSSSKKTVLIVIIGVVGAAGIIAASAVLIYELKRASRKVVSLDRAKNYKVEESVDKTTGPQNQKKDEGTSILGEVSRIQPTENSRIQPLESSEQDRGFSPYHQN